MTYQVLHIICESHRTAVHLKVYLMEQEKRKSCLEMMLSVSESKEVSPADDDIVPKNRWWENKIRQSFMHHTVQTLQCVVS